MLHACSCQWIRYSMQSQQMDPCAVLISLFAYLHFVHVQNFQHWNVGQDRTHFSRLQSPQENRRYIDRYYKDTKICRSL